MAKEIVIKPPVTRDSVFVAGGQPSVTYVDRDHLKIEDALRRALKVPNQIVSLAGPTKTGKTVLVKQILDGAPGLRAVRSRRRSRFGKRSVTFSIIQSKYRNH